VLVVDLDPQACLTYSLGFDPDELDSSLHDVLVRRARLTDVVKAVPGVPNLDLAPATIDLAGAEVHLLTRTGREHVLAQALAPVLDDYHAVLIDCPPSLGVLTINGLTAAEAVIAAPVRGPESPGCRAAARDN
jgi:chromosome partitioning protein